MTIMFISCCLLA